MMSGRIQAIEARRLRGVELGADGALRPGPFTVAAAVQALSGVVDLVALTAAFRVRCRAG